MGRYEVNMEEYRVNLKHDPVEVGKAVDRLLQHHEGKRHLSHTHYEKPPVGVTPAKLFWQLRSESLQGAIDRYRDAGLKVPRQWEEEKQTIDLLLRQGLFDAN